MNQTVSMKEGQRVSLLFTKSVNGNHLAQCMAIIRCETQVIGSVGLGSKYASIQNPCQ